MANKIVPGPKDYQYGEPKGTKFEKLYLKKKGWAKNLKNRFKLSAANNIRSLTESGFGLNIPLSDWKDIPSGIKNDPDFIKLRLKRLKAEKNG